MKTIKTMILSSALCLLAVIAVGKPVSAKTYYDTKYNHVGKEVSFTQKSIVSMWCVDHWMGGTKKADFNKDGKKETVTLKPTDYAVYVSINGKRVISVSANHTDEVNFKTYKVGKNVLAVLSYGDYDLQFGRARIYKWEKGNKLKLIKSFATSSAGLLSVGMKNGNFIVKDMHQIERRNWSSALVKKYSKYKNRQGTSIYKTVYSTYSYSNGKLKKKGSNTYYRVGNAAD